MKVILVGNCQVEHIASFMQQAVVDESVEITAAKPVYLIEQEEVAELHNQISQCDLLICQPIGDEYRSHIGLGTKYLQSLLNDSARSVVIPNLYYDASFPSFGYFKDEFGEAIRASDEMWTQNLPWGDYHDFLLFASVIKGLDASQYIELVNKPPLWDTEKLKQTSVSQMAQRDIACDIKGAEIFSMLDPIELANAFHSYNHPTNNLMSLLTIKILELVGLSYTITDFGDERLLHPKLPIYSVTAGGSSLSNESLKGIFSLYRKEYLDNLEAVVSNVISPMFINASRIIIDN